MRTLLVIVLVLIAGIPAAVGSPEGQMSFALQVSLAPVWFDPADTTSTSIPFIVLYAVHDALVKSMPGQPMAPSLAESWTVSPDGLVYEFVLRRGVKFHNGDPVTAEDVKFSFERYRGTAASVFKSRIATVEVVDAQRVRFRLKQSWPDFMTYYGTPATGAGWIVPKKYLEKVGDEGFKRAPIGAGPYKFASFNPGIELVLEANEQYWRKTPTVRTLVFRAVPDSSTRLAMLKRGEADVAYTFRGVLAEEVRRTPGLTLKAVSASVTEWLYFAEQWDPKSPWPIAGFGSPRISRSIDRRSMRRRHWVCRASHSEHHSQGIRLRLGGAALRVRSGPSQAAARRGRIPQRLRRGDALL
jgi:peptide/nickel transport system substrate-binding protein